MTYGTIQNSFIAGEVSPELYGRTDLAKWRNGAATMRNCFANYRGGASSRAGTAYVGTCKQPGAGAPPRDIPFQFNINQGYALEFGDQYMRIKSEGAYVIEAANAITGITNANPGVFTYTNTNYTLSNGDWIFIESVGGMTNFNGLTWIVTGVSGSDFSVTDLFGNPVDTTSFPTYTSGGNLSRIYTVVAPYAAVDLPYLKFTQSADTMSLTCVNTSTNTEYPPYDLERFGATNWTFTEATFTAVIQPPTGVTATAQSSTALSTWYSYLVTAVDAVTGEESVASSVANVENNDISVNAGSNTITWNPVAGAGSYNIYRATPSYSVGVPIGSLYGFMGTAFGTQITDTNIEPNDTIVPPAHNNPFAKSGIVSVIPTAGGSGLTQATVGYTLTTSTGTGFVGSPVVVGDTLAAFIIQSTGQNYSNSDSIAIGTFATGTYTFTANPTNGQTIILDGVTWTFTTGTPSGNQTKIHTTVASTLMQLASDLAASTNASIKLANYGISGLILDITYKTIGTGGNSYTLAAGTYAGAISAGTLTGGATSTATVALTIGPATGTYPSAVAYFQQRRFYAGTLNSPDTYFASKPGLFLNMDTSTPVQDNDAIVGTPWAQQVNGIQFMVPMPGGLVILTGKGAWQLNGGAAAALTPSDETATPQAYNGCSNLVPPLVVNYDILYVQAKGSIVRDLAYNFFVNIYTGTDLTVLSNHLFTNHQILQWAYCEEPYKLVWAVREDGILLSLTYLKEQDVYAWTRHDTNGLFQGVCSITERHLADVSAASNFGPYTDALYLIVQRYVQGQWMYYSERMDDRIWLNVEDCFCVDAGLQWPMSAPNAVLTASTSLPAAGVTFTASTSVFSAANVGDIIRMGGGKATVTAYVSGTVLTATITQAITTTVPNDPELMPVPAVSGNWTITPPTNVVEGLNHLEGKTVAILADGGVLPNQVVTNGTVTFPQACSAIVVGLPYLPQVQTLYLDPQGTPTTVQGKRKNIYSVTVRVSSSRGISVGTNQPDASTQPNGATVPWTDMIQVKERNALTFAGTAIPLKTGDEYLPVPGDWETEGQVAVQQSFPLPMNILAVVCNYQLGDSDG